MKDNKQKSLRWPSAKRGMQKILQSFSNNKHNEADIEQYEGGEGKENSVAPVNFYPTKSEVGGKSADPGGLKNMSEASGEHEMVDMAMLPKAGGEEMMTVDGEKRKGCPRFKIFGEEDTSAEWIDFVQDQLDKFVVSITCVGLIFFAFYSITYKEFKPFTYWVCIVALTSIGDNIGNYGADIPKNRCRMLVVANFFTGGAAMAFAVLAYLKCKEHDEVWDAIEAKIEKGDQTWFLNAKNAEKIKELDAENIEWQDDWVAMTAVDWGHAWLCFLLAGAELLQSAFIVLLKKGEGGEVYGQGNDKFKNAQAISLIIQSVIQLVVMLIAWQVEGHLVKADYMAALMTCVLAIDRLLDNITALLDHVFDQQPGQVHCGVLGN